jgi:hypothetical protein
MTVRLTPERMLEITAECDKYEIMLAHDPAALGITYLQDMIANCRNFTNHTARLLNEVHRAKMYVHLELKRKETAFKIAADGLLATNPIVRNLPNIKDRESQINIMLRDEHREIMNLTNDDLELNHIEDYVARRHRELKDTMKEIQTQRNLVKDEHSTGSMYGDERPTSMGNPADAYRPGAGSKPEGIDVEDVERMLRGEVTEETVVETPEGEAPKPVQTAPSEPPDEPTPPLVATILVTPPEQVLVVEEPLFREELRLVGTVLFEAVAISNNAVTPPLSEPKSEEDQIRAFLDVKKDVEVVQNGGTTAPGVHATASEDDYAELLGNL